jgi:hypothetical protein
MEVICRFERRADPIKTLDIGNARILRKGDMFEVTLPYLLCDCDCDGQGYTHRCIAVKDEKTMILMNIGKYKIPQLVTSENRDRIKDYTERREIEFYLLNVGYGTAYFDEKLNIWKIEENESIR